MLLEKRKNKKKRPDVMSTELGISRTRGVLGDFERSKKLWKKLWIHLDPIQFWSIVWNSFGRLLQNDQNDQNDQKIKVY